MSELAPSPLSVGIFEWLVGTPLESSAGIYVGHLIRHGYALRTMQSYVAGIAHFSHWLAGEHIELADIDETVISCFVDRHLPRCRCSQYTRCSITSNSAALGHLPEHLRVSGKVAALPLKAQALIDRELAEFEHYLLKVRGVGAKTCYYRLKSISHCRTGRWLAIHDFVQPIRATLRRSSSNSRLAIHNRQYAPRALALLAVART
jgi:hypothetical protein